MNRYIIPLALIGALACVAPASAQAVPPVPSAPPAAPLSPAAAAAQATARIAELEGALARQTGIADNARQEVDALRAEIRLKDELLVLGRERNAELFGIAKEITDKYVRSRSVDPFIQSSRVRMENLKQGYEDRLHAARIYASTLPPSVQQRMEAELAAPKGDAAVPPAASAAATPTN